MTWYKQAFKHLLDLHVLFSSNNSYAQNGNPHPTASLSLTLDDEVQYRCAGFIQAEIERYADFLDDNHEEEATSQPSEDGSGQENDVADNPIKTRKTRRSKKVHTGGAF